MFMAKTKAKKIAGRSGGKTGLMPRLKDSKLFEIPNYAQTYEFTSSAASIMMVLKYLNKNYKMKKSEEFEIWQDAISGSVWHGSRYGLAYALVKRGALPMIISNVKDEGYEKKLAVFEGINLDTLNSSFNEIRKKTLEYNVKEQYGVTTINTIKKQINSNRIPIVLVNANALNPYLEPSPHWVVVKGYDKDTFYINDPYSDSTVAMDPDTFKTAMGYESEHHMISVSARSFKKK
jgi:hypothetical protein